MIGRPDRRTRARSLLILVVILAWALALIVLFAPIANADGYGTTSTTTTETTTTLDPTTTPTLPETTTTQPAVEVCRDDMVAWVPADEIIFESDDRIFDDYDRDNCQPPRTTTTTLPPEIIIKGPPISRGSICPGTDGVVYELPWGTYDEMYVEPWQAAANCPIAEIPAITDPAPTQTVETLPFTGPDPGPGLGLAIGTILTGSILLRLGRKAET